MFFRHREGEWQDREAREALERQGATDSPACRECLVLSNRGSRNRKVSGSLLPWGREKGK